MKKVVSLILALIMLMPSAMADTSVSNELEKVLLTVKSRVDIPAELSEFESDVNKLGEKTHYNFDWHDTEYKRSISVGADEKGRVTNYHNYSNEVSQKKLSGISKSEIIAFADAFLKKILPEMYSDSTDVLIFNEKNYSAGGSLRYSLTYDRYKNSLQVKGNRVNITLCVSEDDRLYIRDMSANIDYDTSFVQAAEKLPDFEQKYKESFPVELVYQNEYNSNWKIENGERTTPFLIYRIKDNNAGIISLENGEIIEEDREENGIFRSEAAADATVNAMGKNEALSEKELAEISAVEGLMSVEEIKKLIKKLPHIEFPEKLKLESSSLSKDTNGKYVYNLHYRSGDKDDYSYFSASVYAENGKLLSLYFNDNNEYKKTELTKAKQEKARAKAEEFLKMAAQEEFVGVALEMSEATNAVLNTNYYRLINGIKHINDGIRVSYDAVNNYIVSFSLNFTDGEFTEPEKAVSAEAAYEKLLEYSPIVKMYVKSGGKYIECASLEKHGVILDAVTGEIKNAYNGEESNFSYSDIKGHWVEEAAAKLAEIQIGLDGEKLNPDTKITQEEFLRLMASGIYGKYYHTYNREDLYEALIREKTITEEEKNPDAEVKREEAFVYLIRMANLERIAKLKDIYKIDFADADKLSDGKIGYCAILGGLGVICGDGGYLRPENSLTRGETVIMLYRYLLSL